MNCKDRNIIHLDGRDSGKSISLTTDALHFAFTKRGGQGLIATPHQGHLDALAEEIEFQIDSSPELSASIGITKYGKPKIFRKPYFRIEFSNGSILYFRPAGTYGDAFRSLHVERVWVDEGAWLTEKAWKALRQCLKAGGTLRIYSTPNGLRDTTYYRLTSSDQFKVFRWPSWLNPAWNAEREAELIEFYGGKQTAGWQHEVAGEHGKPSYGVFNIDVLTLCRQEIIEYQKISIMGEDIRSCQTEEESYDRLEMLLNLMPQTGVFWMGGDLGYTNDPTEIVVFQEVPQGERSVLSMVLRVHLEHVTYPHISQVISLLERYFTPVGIGLDNGGNGLAVVQELLTLDKYKPMQLEGRLRGYDFGGVTSLSVRDGREMRKRTKELMTTLITGALQRRQLILPVNDPEIEDQFTTHTYTLSNGNIIYSKGNDHIIDAVRCAVLMHEHGSIEAANEQMVCLMPVLTNPIFY
ncbi:MAG: terminase large subunit domain-containing protein [Armatimonadota bacterium]